MFAFSTPKVRLFHIDTPVAAWHACCILGSRSAEGAYRSPRHAATVFPAPKTSSTSTREPNDFAPRFR